jgi:tetratricopeptide (TPR) repeat protein
MRISPFFAAYLLGACLYLAGPSAPPLMAVQRATQAEAQKAPDTVENPDELIRRADAMRQQGEIAAAEQALQQAIRIHPESIEANDALGELLLSQQRYSEAMDRFEAVLTHSAHDSRASAGEQKAAITLALQARQAGKGDEALIQLQRARVLLPDDVTILVDLGIQAQSMHQLSFAADALNDALKISPSDPRALYAAARVEMDQEHFAEAEKHFHAYLAQHPNDASAHYGLGHLFQMQLRIADARAEFERSIALQPVQTESYYQLGEMALDAGHDDEATRMFAKTLSRMPTHGGALTGVGILAFRAKNYAAARDSLTKAVAAAPDYQPAHYYLGLSLRRLGDKEGSARELKIAVDLAAKQQGKGKPTYVITPPAH